MATAPKDDKQSITKQIRDNLQLLLAPRLDRLNNIKHKLLDTKFDLNPNIDFAAYKIRLDAGVVKTDASDIEAKRCDSFISTRIATMLGIPHMPDILMRFNINLETTYRDDIKAGIYNEDGLIVNYVDHPRSGVVRHGDCLFLSSTMLFGKYDMGNLKSLFCAGGDSGVVITINDNKLIIERRVNYSIFSLFNNMGSPNQPTKSIVRYETILADINTPKKSAANIETSEVSSTIKLLYDDDIVGLIDVENEKYTNINIKGTTTICGTFNDNKDIIDVIELAKIVMKNGSDTNVDDILKGEMYYSINNMVFWGYLHPVLDNKEFFGPKLFIDDGYFIHCYRYKYLAIYLSLYNDEVPHGITNLILDYVYDISKFYSYISRLRRVISVDEKYLSVLDIILKYK